MVVVPLSTSGNDPENAPCAQAVAPVHWVRVAAAGSLALSGVLLMAGKSRAGLVAAVSGTALAMMDQPDTMKTWWNTLPIYLEEIQSTLSRVQGAVEDIAAQREKLRRVTGT
jgi:hypothetical protein